MNSTMDYAYVHFTLEGRINLLDRGNFERFRGLCESAFLTIRRNGSLIISILAMMISTGLPELSKEEGRYDVVARLGLHPESLLNSV